MTVDFSHGYQPPGVYIDEEPTALVSVTGIPPTLVALVGPAIGYQTYTERVPFNDLRLTQRGIDTASVEIVQQDTGDVVATGDYTLTPTTAGAEGTRDYYVDLTRSGTSTVPIDTIVIISYRYTDPNYYTPRRVDNFEDVKDLYGEPLNLELQETGDTTYQHITSPLSLAAQVAFNNDATELLLAPTAPVDPALPAADQSTARRTALATAYNALVTNYDVSVVVPVTTGIDDADAVGVGTDLRAHVEAASRDGYFRTAVLGFDTIVSDTPDTILNTGGFGSKRLMLVYAAPGGLQYYSGGTNRAFTVGHEYLAAALAGRMSALPVQTSLTRQQVRGFYGVSGTPLRNSLKNTYSSLGITVVEVNRLNRLVVRHALTTDPTNLNTRESSVVRAKDALVTLIQNGADNSGLIGSPIDAETTLNVKSLVSGLLEFASDNGTIESYRDLAVRQRSVDPSVIEVKFAYRPSYPLNYIVVSFSIDMNTGATTELAEAA